MRRNCFIAVILAAFMLSACTAEIEAGAPMGAAKQDMPGFYNEDVKASGGDGQVGLNLYDFEVGTDTGDTVITLTFMNGSLVMGLDESVARGVPNYEIGYAQGLNRLVVTLSDLAFWDYTVYYDELVNTPVLGVYNEITVNSASTKLYISIKDQYVYKVENSENKIKLTLRTLNTVPQSKWYVLLDGVEDYAEGKLGQLDMSPIACADNINSLLVSKAFESETEAKAFSGAIAEQTKDILKDKLPTVVKLLQSQLPDYNSVGVLQTMLDTKVQKRGDESLSAEVLCTNGRVLAFRESSDVFAFTRPFFLKEEGDVVSRYEKIYISSYTDRTEQLLLDYELTDIMQAQFAPSGRKLAFIDQNNNKRTLYIYDIDYDLLISGPEEGIGEDCASFAWASDDVLYALASEMSTTELYTFKFISNKEYQITKAQNMEFTDNPLTYAGGKLYYIRSDFETGKGQAMQLDIATMSEKSLANGISIELNPQGTKAAILNNTEDRLAYTLSIYDLQTGKIEVVESSSDISEFAWEPGGTVLSYTVYEGDKGDTEFPTGLFRHYDGKNERICSLMIGALTPSMKDGEMVLTHIFTNDGQFIPVGYIISAVQQPEPTQSIEPEQTSQSGQ